jgi:predicted phosphate transport protein (TIGR00153 family)
MISLQKLFGKDQMFFDLLEASAAEARTSAGLLKTLIQKLQQPANGQTLSEFAESRHKDKRINRQITEALCRTFFTPLEREDIEALAESLYKIPKRVNQIGERLMLYRDAVPAMGDEFQRQMAILEEATAVVENMVKELRGGMDVQRARGMNDQLQQLEGEADKIVLRMLQALYLGERDAREVIIFKDVFELMEKAIDRCRDAGNTVFLIVLKNS